MTPRWILSVIVALGVAGCDRDPIVVATIGDASDALIACIASDAGTTCPTGMFCETQSCKTTNGLCTSIVDESSDPARYAPQCGCDGVSYFNQSRRQAARVALSSMTTCESQTQTGSPHAACGIFAMAGCPDGTTCAAVFPDPSGPFAAYVADAGAILEAFCDNTPPAAHDLGNCWALPETCPPSSSASLLSCSGCIDACLAIKAGGPAINCTPDPGDGSAD